MAQIDYLNAAVDAVANIGQQLVAEIQTLEQQNQQPDLQATIDRLKGLATTWAGDLPQPTPAPTPAPATEAPAGATPTPAL